MTVAVLLLPIMFIVGAMVDYSRVVSSRSKAQQAVDAAALAGAQELANGGSVRDAKSIANSYYKAQLTQSMINNSTVQISVSNVSGGQNIIVNSAGVTPTSLMKIIGIDSIDWSVKSTAGRTKVFDSGEITLVLDISSSMRKDNRMTNARAGLYRFIDEIFPNGNNPDVSVSFIPYANSINFGSTYISWLRSDQNTGSFTGCFRHEPFHEYKYTGTGTTYPTQYRNYKQMFRKGYPHCPYSSSSALLFSSSPSALKNRIKGLSLGTGTHSNIAMAWAWRTLSPQWEPFFRNNNNYPKQHQTDKRKAIIFLTDGSVKSRDFWGDGVNTREDDTLQAIAKQNYLDVCTAIKNENKVDVYTISYFHDSPALKHCASKPENYFYIQTPDLRRVFSQIAGKLKTHGDIRLVN